MLTNIEGYHGTSYKSAQLIQTSNYTLSIGDTEWLGDGVYFFITGINQKPIEQAEKWAIAQAWDTNLKRLKYRSYCVLKSNIESEEDSVLDLRTEEGYEVFEYLVDKFFNKIKHLGKRLEYLDGLILNLARGEGIVPLDVVIGNFYIKFTKERINRINLRTNNCTICTVLNPADSILSTKIVKTGTIK